MMNESKAPRPWSLIAGCVALLLGSAVSASDWAAWRGPLATGSSTETGLPASWSPAGENVLWRIDFVGRSTPVVFDGRVCANGRTGEGIDRVEMVACFDPDSGAKLWERKFHVVHSTVPWTRVGWAAVTGDPETGYLYVQGVGGQFLCLDRHGEVVWQKNLMEEYGFMEGYGGRTQTPTVDQERIIVTFANNSWGALRIPRHRLFAFDKRSGELLWISSPASSMADKNSQSTPAVMVVGGRRLIVHGNGSGDIFAVDAHTGEPVWGFKLSARAINSSVVADGETVFATHSEENIDEPTMGRVVAIDASGHGDVTKTHEKWRTAIGAGFSSPALAGGRLYVLDNSAELHALDSATGAERWTRRVGRVGKGSPVVADGKIYVTEVNGKMAILQAGDDGAEILSQGVIRLANRRPAETYSSVAISNGRLYFVTEEGMYAIGPKEPKVTPTPPRDDLADAPAPPDSPIAMIQVRPAEVRLGVDGEAHFRVEAFDAIGRPLGTRDAEWSLEGLAGEVAGGAFHAAPAAAQAGMIVGKIGDLVGKARVRVVREGAWSDDFESYEVGATPPYVMHAVSMFKVEEQDGNKFLVKGRSPREVHRHPSFFGPAEMSGYTVRADVLGTRTEHDVPDMGLINSGYTLDFIGTHNKLQLRSWPSALRMMQETPMQWQADTWYTMVLRVDRVEGTAWVRAKVWPRGTEEPVDWSLVAEDTNPVPSGSPGLFGNSPTPIHYDNFEVTLNQ